MVALTIIFYILLSVYEFVPLYKQKQWKDLWVNTALGVFSFTFAILLSLGIKIPSPSTPIREVITSVFGR